MEYLNKTKEGYSVKETTQEVTKLLSNAYANSFLRDPELVRRYNIASKTGTALLIDRNGSYKEDEFLHSFFGYFPAYKPRVFNILVCYRPEGC